MTRAHGGFDRDWTHWRTIEGGYLFDRQALVEAYLCAVGEVSPGDAPLPRRARAFIDAWPPGKETGRARMNEVFGTLLDRDVLHCPHGLPVGIDLARVPAAHWIPDGFLAGPAMGSGESAWTRASLIALERVIRPGDRVLDIGTGAGILALRCRSLGAESVLGLDIDPLARAIARYNVRLAGADRAIAIAGEAPADWPGTRIVIAMPGMWEILPVLHPRLPALPPGGSIVAGPMEGLAEAIHLETAIRDLGVRPIDLIERDGWYALIGEKPNG